MFDPKQFEDISKRLFASLPESVQNFEKDIQKKFKEILQAAFSNLDLVTRDEFDVQAKVLARTREKLDALEEQVERLTKQKTKKNG